MAVIGPAHAAGERTVAECVAIALAQHPSLKAATASIEAGERRVWQSASGYLPQLNSSYAANRRNTSVGAATGSTSAPVGFRTQTFNFYSTGVTLSQVLFDFGQTLASIRANEATVRALSADRDTQRATVTLNVKQAYFGLLAAQRLERVADDTVRQTAEHLRLAQGRYDVGLAARFDVTREQVQVANAELTQVTARNNVAIARETLRSAMGLTGPLDFGVVDTLAVQSVAIPEDDAVRLAYAHRPELASLAAQQDTLREQIAARQRDYLPRVTGSGTYQWSGNSYPLDDTWNIGAAVNLSLFNGGLTTAQIGELHAQEAKLEYDQETEKLSIALEVRQARLDVARAAESIRVTEKALREARENLDLAEGRYKTGVGNVIEVTDAQALLTTAEANYVQALYGYQTSLATLEKATAYDWTTGPAAPEAPR